MPTQAAPVHTKAGEYLVFMHYYSTLHGYPPAAADIQWYSNRSDYKRAEIAACTNIKKP